MTKDACSTPFYGGPTLFNRLSMWVYLALAFVVLTLAAVILYMIYTCYHTAGLREFIPATFVFVCLHFCKVIFFLLIFISCFFGRNEQEIIL